MKGKYIYQNGGWLDKYEFGKDIEFLNSIRGSISKDINDPIGSLGQVSHLTQDWLTPELKVSDLQIGQEFEVPRFMSTYYKNYSANGPLVSSAPYKLNIQLNPESKGLVMDNYGLAYTPSENEILLNRNSGFRVKAIRDREANIPGTRKTRQSKEVDLEHLYASGGNIIKDNNGYWDPSNWGKSVEIDGNDITMENVYQPLLGIGLDSKGSPTEKKLMKPGQSYHFKGKSVVELPIALNGISQESDRNGSQLGQLTDFSNKQNKANWLEKYR